LALFDFRRVSPDAGNATPVRPTVPAAAPAPATARNFLLLVSLIVRPPKDGLLHWPELMAVLSWRTEKRGWPGVVVRVGCA
jgi:hypothetical protein